MSEHRVNPLLDLVSDAEAGKVDGPEIGRRLLEIAADARGDVALVDEAVALGVLPESKRAATMRLLSSSPQETRDLLNSMGLAEARAAAEFFGWDVPTSGRSNATSDDLARAHEADLADRLGVAAENLL